ncbi:MAG: hypothetical protein K9N09_08970 [Candidatus Cloacimonetes bacterium]|nr:hypothetical protein [Candidatus Cloacimonadota bacterium]MCF7813974.1 hypothetical protein [Candidatus Cloacimonadota bacterium]MCF7868818.1 hypothetical protein [Candidatus Cloacimonadota bacterium]MCF7884077.1 hypothetical protein [Candidatus Cloacimonadota bacterium]
MKKIEKRNLNIDEIPQEAGYYFLSGEANILFCGKTQNLRKSIQNIRSVGKDDKNIFQLFSLTRKINYQVTDSLFSALLEEKKIIEKHHPQFNDTIKQYQNYVYLAIDFYNVPFFKITEHTTENYYYLGPFKNRFYLYDLIDVMADLFRLPSCEDENFPCRKLKDKTCLGWCLKSKPELAEMLLLNYLQINVELVPELQKKLEKLESDLEFQKAEKLKKQIAIIKDFYDKIRFFHVTKKLDSKLKINDADIDISAGMVLQISSQNKIYDFVVLNPEYRDNEFLAHDKSEYSERFIIFKEFCKNKLEQIESIYKASTMEMKKKLEMND